MKKDYKNISLGISIVSHNNEADIIKNHSGYTQKLNGVSFNVVVTDNLSSDELKEFCECHNYTYQRNDTQKGFGENNNQNVNLLKDEDVILILNPDVYFDIEDFTQHLQNIYNLEWHICGANVTEQNELKKTSHRRIFPSLLDPFISFLFKKKYFLLDPSISSEVDWVGGSFMIIRNKTFKYLGGFDSDFFMYYEDIDLCKRAKQEGFIVYYFSEFTFYHFAQRAGHKLFSKAFMWNIQSMIKYFLKYPTKQLIGPNKY